MNKWRAVSVVVGFLLLSFAAASTGMMFKPGEWYASLNKPFFTPPNFVFPIVWTFLYVLMAIAASLVYLAPQSSERRQGLILYSVQIGLNATWSFVFFGQHWISIGLLNIGALLVFVVLTMRYFRRVHRRAFYLLIPYLIWGGFAFVLNASIFILNSAN